MMKLGWKNVIIISKSIYVINISSNLPLSNRKILDGFVGEINDMQTSNEPLH